MRTFAMLFVTAGWGVLAFAQTPAFEVADVHVSPRATRPSVAPFDSGTAYAPNRMKGGLVRGGIYELRNASMVDLVATAYGVDADRVTGGPNWLENDRFDVIAKVPDGTNAEAVKVMLQGLLASRFGLTTHRDETPLPAYVLTAGKRLQLKASDGAAKSGCQAAAQNAQRGATSASYSCHGVTMAAFADTLRNIGASYMGSVPVADQTGLQGAWDFDVKWTARQALAAAGADGISLFDAVDKQLGLRLEMKQVAMPVIVVDGVNQKPTENSPDVLKKLPAPATEFEVADVKPSPPGGVEGGGVLPGGRIEMRGSTMQDFIKFAWNIDDSDDDTLTGGPKWLDADHFDIVAKAPVSETASGQLANVDALRPMMKALLIDRFKLKVHTQEAPIAVYVLNASRNVKLKKADPASRSGCKSITAMPGDTKATALTRSIECRNTTMAQFADLLRGLGTGYVDHPVVDATGLAEAWDFTLSFTPRRDFRNSMGKVVDAGGAALDPNGALSLFEALDKQLGLKLEAQKRSMPVVVVDSVERRPTDN